MINYNSTPHGYTRTDKPEHAPTFTHVRSGTVCVAVGFCESCATWDVVPASWSTERVTKYLETASHC